MIHLLAASTQRTIGLVIAALLGGAALAFTLYKAWQVFSRTDLEVGSEIELAPNRREYLSDEELETNKLTMSLFFGLGLITLVAVILPLYWLGEPGRHAGAENGFENRFASRGSNEYAELCTSCHGAGGGAGAAAVTLTDDGGNFIAQVNWAAPALNTVLTRFDEDELRFILNWGRNGVMPAWGAPGGGPLTAQQVDNLVFYMRTIQLSPEEIQEQVDGGVVAGKREVILAENSELAALVDEADELAEAGDSAGATAIMDGVNSQIDAMVDEFVAIATDPASADPGSPNYDTYLEWGELLFTNRADGGVYGCARCHTAGWSYQAAGVQDLAGNPLQDGYVQGGGGHGPNLTGGSTVTRWPDAANQVGFIASGSDEGVKYGSNGAPKTGSGQMPGFGAREDADLEETWSALLTPEQLDAIVAYERSL